MTAQETKLLNAFETTLTGTIGASDTTLTVNSVTDSASNTLTASCYLIINPDSATNREVILVTGVNSGTKTLDVGSVGNRYLTGSAASSGLSHASGSVVRMSPVQQHIEDLNDRVNTIINEAGTELKTTLFLDEDNMSSNSATKGVTQQSVKAYVDTQLGASDLDIISDSGNIDIDLDDDSLTVTGGEGIDTSATGTTLTIAGEDASTSNKGVASFSSDNFAVSSGAVTIKDSGVSNDELAGSIANAKLANSSITVTDGSSSTAISLGGTATFAAGEGLDVGESSGTITFSGEDATTSNKGVASFSSDNFSVSSGAVTIKAGGVDLAAEVTGTLPVANGGTGATSLTDGGVLLGSGTGAITATGVLANGQLLIGDGTSDPTVATLTEGSNITITEGAGSITIASTDTNTTYTAGDGLDLSGTTFSTDLKSNGGLVIESTELAVDLGASSITGTLDETDGGTGLTSYTTGDVIYASGSNTLAKLAIGSAGQVLKVSSGGIVEWAADSTNTYSAGTLLDLSGTTFNVDLSEAAEAAIADGDYILFLDGGATGTAKKEAVADLATLLAGTGLTASSSVIGVDTSQNITALTGGDLTIYEDANNADVSLKMGTSATESLTIEVLNGGSNKTAEQINFTTATASGTADHGKMVFNVDETLIATIDDGGIDLATGKEFSVNGTAIGGSANALVTDNSDFTLTDTGTATGIHYELDNVDTADWNQGGIALTSVGGIFRHSQEQNSTYTVASTEGAVVAGPISIGSSATVTIAGTMVIL